MEPALPSRQDLAPPRGELRPLLALAMPIAASQVGIVAIELVETAILGHTSAVELAGASLARSIGSGVFTLAFGLATAIEPIAAQAIGAGEPGRAWAALHATLRILALLWFPLTLVMYALSGLLGPLGVDAEVAARCRACMLGQAPGLGLTAALLTTSTFLQAHGRIRPMLWAVLAANVSGGVLGSLLIAGDPVLVALRLPPCGLPRLGALGAGLSFSVSMAVAAAIAMHAARSLDHGRPGPPLLLGTVLRLGLPIGLQLLAELGTFTVLALCVAHFGRQAVAAHQVVFILANLTNMAVFGIGCATAVRVGYAIGTRRSPRPAGIGGMASGIAFMAAAGVALAAASTPILRAFTHEAAIVDLGRRLIFIVAGYQLFDGLQVVGCSALRGAGDVRFPFVATVIAHWGVGVPLAVLLALGCHKGVLGIWYGLSVGTAVVGVAVGWRFLRLCRRIDPPVG
jgi:MATE family multidrug resistance protein